MSNEKCPYCGGYRSRGAPHDPGYIYQWECLGCGRIEGVSKSSEDV